MKSSSKLNSVAIVFKALVVFLFYAPSALAEKLTVQVSSVKVREVPSLTAPSVGELKYKQIVQQIIKQGAFLKIRSGDMEGWIPVSAVTSTKKLKIRAGNKVDLAEPEAMAAGKGGDQAASKALDSVTPAGGQKGGPSPEAMQRVDAVEAATPESDEDVRKFKDAGGLKGGQRGKKKLSEFNDRESI